MTVIMEPKKIILAILVICFCNLAKGKLTYKKCTLYGIGEPRPPVPNGMGRSCDDLRYCENVKDPVNECPSIPLPLWKMKSYCLDYKCPTLDCDGADIVKENGKCDRCKGDCEWLGKIVKNGTLGTCYDGCNTCGCMNGEITFSTYIGCSAFFCY